MKWALTKSSMDPVILVVNDAYAHNPFFFLALVPHHYSKAESITVITQKKWNRGPGKLWAVIPGVQRSCLHASRSDTIWVRATALMENNAESERERKTSCMCCFLWPLVPSRCPPCADLISVWLRCSWRPARVPLLFIVYIKYPWKTHTNTRTRTLPDIDTYRNIPVSILLFTSPSTWMFTCLFFSPASSLSVTIT